MAVVLMIHPAGLFGHEQPWRTVGRRTDGTAGPRSAREARSSRSWALALLLAAPLFFYPGVPDEACRALPCSRAPSTFCSGTAGFVVRPCAFFGTAAYVAALRREGWGLTPELAILAGARCGGLAGPRVRRAGDPPPGHLLRDGHAGARADVVFLLPAGAVHPRRGRHPGRAARHLFGVLDLRSARPCTISCSPSSSVCFMLV